MIHKEFATSQKKVVVFRSRSPIQNGYEYFIQVLTKGTFGGWVVNENYKQKTEISSEKTAFRIAQEFLINEI